MAKVVKDGFDAIHSETINSKTINSDTLNFQAISADYDVVIAGGGMVGASLALLLAHHSKEQLKVLVVESFPLPKSEPLQPSSAHTHTQSQKKPGQKPPAPLYSASFDARSTALSYGSRLILEPLGLWPTLAAHTAEINTIHVSDRGHFGSTTLRCDEVDWPSLGYVVENTWFGRVLLAALREKNNVAFCAPATAKKIIPRRAGVELLVETEGDSKNILSQLAIVADGANSSLREQLGIDTTESDYRQVALISNVSFRNPHQGCAFERFTAQGPIALLPLTNSEQGEPRSALVWSLPKDQARHVSECTEQQFLEMLQQRFGHRLGEFTRVGDRFSYPLKLVEAQEQVRSGIVVMGNAAHSLHPVAGQGFNLALRNCARLTRLLIEAYSKHKPQQRHLGALSLLQRYAQQQAFDQHKTIGFSDRLPSLFGSQQWALSIFRSIGLGVLDVTPAVKSQFIRHAAGLNDGAAQA